MSIKPPSISSCNCGDKGLRFEVYTIVVYVEHFFPYKECKFDYTTYQNTVLLKDGIV